MGDSESDFSSSVSFSRDSQKEMLDQKIMKIKTKKRKKKYKKFHKPTQSSLMKMKNRRKRREEKEKEKKMWNNTINVNSINRKIASKTSISGDKIKIETTHHSPILHKMKSQPPVIDIEKPSLKLNKKKG